MEPPKRIELSVDEQSQLIARVEEDSLTSSDRDLVVGLIKFNHWLQNALTDKKVTIHKLKHAFFSTADRLSKKPSRNLSKTSDKSIAKNPKPKNRGRMGQEQYANIETIEVKHISLKAGQISPEDCGGRLWPAQPGNIIKITGQGFAKATKYVQQKLRCGLCGLLLSAPLPSTLSDNK